MKEMRKSPPPGPGRPPDTRESITAREILIAGAALLALTSVFFSGYLLFPTRMPYYDHSDAIRQILVWKNFIYSSLRSNGELPLWLPFIWSGQTFVGNIQTQLFYPLSIPFYFLRTELYCVYYMLLHVVLSGLFMYSFTRLVGLPKTCAFFAALVYMFGGIPTSFHYQAIDWIVCWIPALFCCVEMLLRKRRAAWAVITGLVMAVYFLGSHPQLFYYSVLAATAYFALRVFAAPRTSLRLMSLGALAGLVCAGVAAIGLFPFLEAAHFSPRAGGVTLYHSTYESLPVKELPSFFLPRFLGGSRTCHEGLVACLLVAAALVGPRNRTKLFFLGAALFSLLYSMGKYTPVYMVLFKLVPGFNLFREPTKMLILFGFSIPVICAFGLGDLLEALKDPSRGRRFKASLRRYFIVSSSGMLLAAASLTVGRPLLIAIARALYRAQGFTLPFEAHRETVVSMLGELSSTSLLLLSIAMGAGAVLWLLMRIRGRYAALLGAALIVAELVDTWSFALPALKNIDTATLYSTNELIEFFKGREGIYRVLNMGGERSLPQYQALPNSIELADGYNPVITKMYMLYTSRICGLDWAAGGGATTKLPMTDLPLGSIKKPDLLGLLNVKYILSEELSGDDRFHLIRTFHDVPVYRQEEGMVVLPEVYVYENKSWLPRAFLVGDSVACGSEEECLDALGTVDVRKTLVTREGGGSYGEPKGTVEFLERTPNRIVIEAETDRPSYLFIGEMWYPGWVAFDNGRRVAVNRADYLFRSVPLKEGRHRIEMLYRPASFLAGKWVSAITLSLSLGYLFFTRKKWWAQ